MDEFLADSAALFGDAQADDENIRYGPLVLSVAPKEGKANTLLADHLFSPSLLLAEQIERNLIQLSGKTVIELGAGCALPSLLASTLHAPPSTIVITDYPDEVIIGNLKNNVQRNGDKVAPGCTVRVHGYEWGQDAAPLLELHTPQAEPKGYDVVILSDLLHFDRSHDVLLASLVALLRKDSAARAYVAAGKYTPAHHCASFVREAERLGIVLEEREVDGAWKGLLPVTGGGLNEEQLSVRKNMCRWWVGRWAADRLV
ncbi:hypothetical protein CERSUDRAFT_138985 [Gelatoporia subvermispora B]|uniref:Uncharacterized protein n=1 Tax=Ceriporiopsis subvermispora (strain B) TaxID=914234 RepID=M2R965_CERS8|nr:hypothetical protein CERSUDRAFT_138985 [Gelatoporia subvermispora B]